MPKSPEIRIFEQKNEAEKMEWKKKCTIPFLNTG